MVSGSATFTADFRDEFEAERTRWLRRRFLWWTGTIGALGIVQLLIVIGVAFMQLPRSVALLGILMVMVNAGAVATFATAFLWAKREKRYVPRNRLLRFVSAIIVIVGVLNLIEIPIQYFIAMIMAPNEVNESAGVQNWVSGWMANVMIIHLLASAFIPWTPREAIRPVLPLIGAAALVLIIYAFFASSVAWWVALLIVCMLPLVSVPGLLIAAWRHSRFRRRFFYNALRGRYHEMKQELTSARQIHESMFPAPIHHGPIRLEYRYEPMRQIGGDYLYARMIESEPGAGGTLNVVVLDVTGHGISAALTVNRLYGEIDRQFGEDPNCSPGQLLSGLNSYLHHSLALHSVYATALCVRIDPNRNVLEWASAGHPPAFIRGSDSTIHQLDSTTLVLGACHGGDFAPNQQSQKFLPGDVLLAYTDGATECRNTEGRMLRVDGLHRLVATVKPEENGGWAAALLRAIDEYRFGPPQDDTLVVEIYRPFLQSGHDGAGHSVTLAPRG